MDSEIIRLLSDLVSIETVNDPARKIKPTEEAPECIKEELEKRGIKSKILEKNGYYTVFGKIGKGKPIILMLAHFDTVPVDYSRWNYHPFELTIKHDRGYGRGVLDDKSNVAAMIVALGNLVQKIKGKSGTIVFAFTGDEEIGGFHCIPHLIEKLKKEKLWPDYLVNGDGHGMNVIVRRRSAFKVEIRVPVKKSKMRGRISLRRFEASTPIYETRHAAYFMPGVDEHPLIAAAEYLFFNPHIKVVGVKGNFTKSNVIPDWVEIEILETTESSEIEVDEALTALLRMIIPVTRAPVTAEMYSDFGVTITPNMYLRENGFHKLIIDVRAMTTREQDLYPIRDIVKRFLPEAEVKISGGTGYLYTREDEDIVLKALETLRELGVEAKPVEACGASDSRYFSPHGVKCIDFGPKGGNVHGHDEYVILHTVELAAKFYEKLALKLLSIT